MDEFHRYLAVLADLDAMPAKGSRVLDFGCGRGELVRQARAAGYEAYGCDFAAELAGNHCSTIETPYRLPYPDAHFDCVVSDQVLEHVMDYDAALAEMRRVLRPGGVFLHLFPSRLMPIEPHTWMPLGTIIRAPGWLRLWAALGVRNAFQRGMSAAEVARRDRDYLMANTHYPSRGKIRAYFTRHLGACIFVERHYLPHSPQRALRMLARMPLSGWLYRTFRGRVVFGRHGAQM
jgi:SAM-dependent methyltransferase